ncbi:MAG: DUF4450 domain-containing protein [Prevotellaceae bacterium]|jgi:hypothetical protein|nr:DUF4450 domain-containing protein [Prevotellaceae bacterium]
MQQLSILCILLLYVCAYGASAQPDAAYWHGKERTLRYAPEGTDFVIVNGDKRFNRALYGTNTGFRVEAGDLPEFGLYLPSMGGNMQLGVIRGGESRWLNDFQHIKAIYRPGAMIYELSDPFCGELQLTALAMSHAEGMVIRVAAARLLPGVELFWTYGGASNERFPREGDLGVDPPGCFALKPEACAGNVFSLSGGSAHLAFGRKGREQRLACVFPEGSRLKLSSPYAVTTPLDMWQSAAVAGKPLLSGRCEVAAGGEYFLAVQRAQQDAAPPYGELKASFEQAEASRSRIAQAVQLSTPDPYFNPLGGALSIAADGIWEPNSWLHGAVGWRMRLTGWRAAYTGDAVGWHDRARRHFDGYAAAQVTDVEPVTPHPAQDSALNLARAAKKWGTPMYSNGYICRNPHQTGVMHHYDMNLCYVDELLWHFAWTGDVDYARTMWPVLERHLAWEKRNFDPDDDGLYDAYCCIWASDALQYNSGGVTHSSAYCYRANRMAAEIAPKVGKNPKPYADEAEKIRKAVNRHLWLQRLGRWAEYKDFMGRKEVHPEAAVWTVYHAIDAGLHDPFQAYQATRYIDTEIPHIPVRARGLKDEGYATVSTTSWMPYSWSINNVAFAEVNSTALAYWQSGRYEEAFRLFKSSILDGMYLGASPGNFGQISFYDAARGECYRDFGDPVGVASRVIVQGLFGIYPDAMNGRWIIRPGFPDSWDKASITTADVSFAFERTHAAGATVEKYTIRKLPHRIDLLLKARSDRIASLTVNGKKAAWTLEENAAGYPLVKIHAERSAHDSACHVQVAWGGEALDKPRCAAAAALGETWELSAGCKLLQLHDPQGALGGVRQSKSLLTGVALGEKGSRTLFVRLEQGQMRWWQPVHLEIVDRYEVADFDPEASDLRFALRNNTAAALSGTLTLGSGSRTYAVPVDIPAGGKSDTIAIPAGTATTGANRVALMKDGKEVHRFALTCWNIPQAAVRYEAVPLEGLMNASVAQIFRNEYLTPRSPYTTLQIPKQGIGEWCHPQMTASIDDAGLRAAAAADGWLQTPPGIPFRTTATPAGRNVIFTSLWDNYPDRVEVPLSGRATHAYLLMAGSANHMQYRVASAVVTVEYADGSSDSLALVNPDTWAPIEQDFYADGYAFRLKMPRPYRVHLKSGLVSRNLAKDLKIDGVYGRAIDGGAGIILDLPLNGSKTLKTLRLETRANDVVVGLMALTVVRD